MNKLFNNKANLLALGLAVAAIFATMFIACASDDPAANILPRDYEAGDLAEWLCLADPTADNSIWVVAKAKNQVPSYVGGSLIGDGYVLSGEKVTPVTGYTVTDGSIAQTGKTEENGTFTEGSWYKVSYVTLADGIWSDVYCKATAKNALTVNAPATAAGVVLAAVDTTAKTAVAAAEYTTTTNAKIIQTGKSTSDGTFVAGSYYKVTYIVVTGGAVKDAYFVAAEKNELTAVGTAATAANVVVIAVDTTAIPATLPGFSVTAATTITATAADSFATGKNYLAEYIPLVGGTLVSEYCAFGTGTTATSKTTIWNNSTATHILKSMASGTAGVGAASGYTLNSGITEDGKTEDNGSFTVGNWYKVSYIETTDGQPCVSYCVAEAKNKLTTALSTAVITAVDTTAKYTKSDVYSD